MFFLAALTNFVIFRDLGFVSGYAMLAMDYFMCSIAVWFNYYLGDVLFANCVASTLLGDDTGDLFACAADLGGEHLGDLCCWFDVFGTPTKVS